MKRTLSALLLCIAAAALQAQQPAASEQIVVSATKLPEQEVDVPADTTVITGAELRARGVQTLSDALATAPGIEAFDGSDQGSSLPNLALWGLKEFDAYLVEVNGVPAGGAFDPDLQQIDVRNIDRIEIVRGPAGVVHGSTAFAGVISIYTADETTTSAEISAGSFGTSGARFATGAATNDHSWSVDASGSRTDGWRVRTAGRRAQIDFNFGSNNVFGGAMKTRIFALDRKEGFGAPLPVDSDTGQLPPGIGFDTNLALRDAQIATRDFGLTSRFDGPVSSAVRMTNVFGYTRRDQRLARTFVDAVDGTSVEGAGTDFRPRANDVFEDLRFEFAPARHRALFGLSVNYGSLDSAGRRFDLAYDLAGPVPSIADIAGSTRIHVTDRRLFAGVYAEDEWTPFARFTATGGVRYDRDDEHRTFAGDEERSSQTRTDGALSGRVGGVYRLLTAPAAAIDTANLYLSANRTFKPASFDPAPQDDEGLLRPERSRSFEGGVKLAGPRRRWNAELTAFDMHLTNIVVSANAGGNPTRVNAGEERFRGVDLSGDVRPAGDLIVRAGLAFHDPRFVHFTAVNEEGVVESADGNLLELVARRSWTLGVAYAPAHNAGGSITVRGVGPRALDRDNVYFTPAYTTVDAAIYVPFGRARLEIAGRNLNNARFYTTDSDLQDGLRYISGPRSLVARVSFAF